MHPPTEQLIRDYLNRLSVAARGRLGFSQRQSLLDRTRARIEAECGGINGGSPVQVRKALAGLGDPIALVELELGQASGKATQASGKATQASGKATQAGREAIPPGGNAIQAAGEAIQAGSEHDRGVMGNGQGMAVGQAQTSESVKGSEIGSEIGKDSPAAGGSNASEPTGPARSIRSARPGSTAPVRRLRLADLSPSATGATPAASAPPGESGRIPSQRRPADGGVDPAERSRVVARPPARLGRRRGKGADGAAPELLAAPDPISGSGPGGGSVSADQQRDPDRRAGSAAAGLGVAYGLLRGAAALVRNNVVEVIAVMLLGVGGAIFQPIWLLGALFALPSKKWDIRDKFVGITLPVLLMIVGTVLILWIGGQRGSIGSYATEAWVGAGRLSRGLAVAGAIYLLWGLRRGRPKPKQPPWNVPHRLG